MGWQFTPADGGGSNRDAAAARSAAAEVGQASSACPASSAATTAAARAMPVVEFWALRTSAAAVLALNLPWPAEVDDADEPSDDELAEG